MASAWLASTGAVCRPTFHSLKSCNLRFTNNLGVSHVSTRDIGIFCIIVCALAVYLNRTGLKNHHSTAQHIVFLFIFMQSYKRHIVSNLLFRVVLSVCLSVGSLLTTVYCGKTADWSEMPFG